MRVYVPATLPSLTACVNTAALQPAPLAAYAVTPALREWYVEGDLEELEYAAMTAAARSALRLLRDDPAAPRRRVVIAADARESDVVFTGNLDHEPSAVRVGTPIAFDAIVSAHVDDPAAEDDVAAAVEALPAADGGDEDAAFAVDGAEGHELAWYAVQELPDMIRQA
ncbi:MAG: DUF6912 family protein [Streptosporangiales bacterium]